MNEKLKHVIEFFDLLTDGHSIAAITIFAVIFVAFFWYIDYKNDNFIHKNRLA